MPHGQERYRSEGVNRGHRPDGSRMRRIWLVTSDANLAPCFARPGDVVGRLHAHQRVHVHSERLFDPHCHLTGKVGILIQVVSRQADSAHACLLDVSRRFNRHDHPLKTR